MKGFLLDTHIWFWYLIGSRRLPRRLRAEIESGADLLLCSVSVWELGMLAERGRIELDAPLRQWVGDAHRHLPWQDAPVNSEVALVSREITFPHRDPADHFIAAATLVYDATLLTVDERFTEADWLPTLSA